MADPRQQTARMAAEAGEHAVFYGVELFDSASEAVARVLSSGLEAASQLSDQSAGEVARVMGLSGDGVQRAAEQTSRNFDAIMQTGKSFAAGFQSIARELADFGGNRAGRNLDKMKAVVCSRTPHEFLAAHTELLRHDLEGFLRTSRRIAETSMRIVDDATRSISESTAELRKAA